MPRVNAPILAFNRGVISRLSLARIDIDRTRLSADTMVNWIPKTQGAMRIRPGLKHEGSSYNDTGATWIDFVASTDETALLEITGGENDTGFGRMRVWIDDDLVTIPTRATSMSDFNADTGQWTKDTGAANESATMGFGDTGLVLNANARGPIAKATRHVSLGDTGDEDTELFLKIDVTRGPVRFRCGTSTGDDDLITETQLRTGQHMLSFTPNDTGGFDLTFQTAEDVDRIIGSISFGDTGPMKVRSPWSNEDLSDIRWAQSADVVFAACDRYKQRRIERRGTGRSWSVVEYQSDNGPFVTKATDVRLKVDATFGNTTLTADAPFFKETHVGALFYLRHQGYTWTFNLAGDGAGTDPIVVSGVNSDNADIKERSYSYKVQGTFSGTLNLMSATGDKIDGPYRATEIAGDASGATEITDTGTFTKNETTNAKNRLLNNVVEYVKVQFEPGTYNSGKAVVVFQENDSSDAGYPGGGDFGVVRVTGFTSSTEVSCEVLRPPTRTDFTDDWREGAWSDAQRWPSAVRLYEGRLWWFGRTFLWASVSDDFENFDDQLEGDSRPIIRSLGEGPVDVISDALGLGRLVIGTTGRYLSARSTSFDEPLTADSIQIKPITTHGAANLKAIQVDTKGIYVHNSGVRAFILSYNVDAQDYVASEITELNPEILMPGVADVAVQRQPDTRIHFVRTDGTVAIFTFEEEGQVLAWSEFTTDTGGSVVEKATVLPGSQEDKVYYHVKRTINGETKRYLEKWAMETESIGDTGLSWISDSAVSFTKDTGTTIAGLDHLEGRQVCVWANDTGAEAGTDDGHDLSNDTGTLGQSQRFYTVASGSIQLDYHHKHGVVGLPYTADWKSTKLAYAAAGGTALAQMKRSDKIAFILADAHNNGLLFGRDFSHLDPLPRVIDKGAAVDSDKIFDDFDQMSMPFPGLWSSDSRICLRAKAPRPVTVMAAVPTIQTNDKI